jgi:putative endonuclease
MPFFVYILKCSNDAFYTGWTTDPNRRLKQHNSGKGASYTKLNGPSVLVYVEEMTDRSSAQKREREIKTWSHQKKRIHIQNHPYSPTTDP